MNRKGILLAGGSGTRLHPSTQAVSKHLLPIYNKPMIYHSLATLMTANVQDIFLISSSQLQADLFHQLLNDGSHLGIHIKYLVQPEPKGIADAFLIAKPFIQGFPIALILGDNIFHGHQFSKLISNIPHNQNLVFGVEVANPQNYGVARLDNGLLDEIIEKPFIPPSNFAVPGLYFYDETVVEKAQSLKPSKRGELEITDLSNLYIKEKSMNFQLLPSDTTWFDAGTHDDLLDASLFFRALEKRTQKCFPNLDLIAKSNGWINFP